MNVTAVIEFFAENPRATAREAGLTNAEANALVGQGKLVPAGNRVTGKRGRPPMEYVVPGTDVSSDEFAHRQVEAARERLRRFRFYERLSSRIMRAANEHGHNSDERLSALADRREAFPYGPPDSPSKNDYLIAGEVNYIDMEDLYPTEVS